MTGPIRPLIVLAGDEDAAFCGPEGYTIPTNHPAAMASEDKEHDRVTRIAIVTGSRVNP